MHQQATRIIYSTLKVLFSEQESIGEVSRLLCTSDNAPLHINVIRHQHAKLQENDWENWLRAETFRLCDLLFTEWSTSPVHPRWLRVANQRPKEDQLSWKQQLIEREIKNICINPNDTDTKEIENTKSAGSIRVRENRKEFLLNAIHNWFLFEEQTLKRYEPDAFHQVCQTFLLSPTRLSSSICKAVILSGDKNVWTLLKSYLRILYCSRMKDYLRAMRREINSYIDAYIESDENTITTIFENTLQYATDPRGNTNQPCIPYHPKSPEKSSKEERTRWSIIAIEVLEELRLVPAVSNQILEEYRRGTKYWDNDNNTDRNGFFSRCFDKDFFSRPEFDSFWDRFCPLEGNAEKQKLSLTEKRQRITPILRILWDDTIYLFNVTPFLEHLQRFLALQIKDSHDLVRASSIQKNINTTVELLCWVENWGITKKLWEKLESIPEGQKNDHLKFWIQREMTEPFVDLLKNSPISEIKEERLITYWRRAGGDAQQNPRALLPDLIDILIEG